MLPRVEDKDESEKIGDGEDVGHPEQEDGWCLPQLHGEGSLACDWLLHHPR